MKTLIVYASKYGCAESCAQELKGHMQGEVTLVNIEKDKVPTIKSYSNVIIGGSIYIGQLNKKLSGFLEKNKQILLTKNLGLFIVCGFLEKANETINNIFPSELVSHAKDVKCFGGEMNTSKMGFLHKKLVGAISKSTDISKIKVIPENIHTMAHTMNAL